MKNNQNVQMLVVEDDSEYLQRILKRLNRYGYTEPDTAVNETEARKSLRNKNYDIIVTDMRLGGNRDAGFIVLDEVKQYNINNINSIVIILTANDTVSDCRKALKERICWDYISKMHEMGSALDELHHSIQDALSYLNKWLSLDTESWFDNNYESLREKYSNKYIAILNATVIESATTIEELRQKLISLQLPPLPLVIHKIASDLPHSMPIIDLLKRDINNPDEGRHLEFKSTFVWDMRAQKKTQESEFKVLKAIAAFMNTEGGTLLIGVQDDGHVYGIDNEFAAINPQKADQDGFELHFWERVKTKIGLSFSQYIKPLRFEKIDHKTVCAVDVLKAPEAAFLPSKENKNVKEFYIRPGNRSEKLDIEQMYKYLRMKKWV